MKPQRMEFDLGQTQYGQPLRLVMERNNAGRMEWTLIQDAYNQRDDTQRVHLTTAQIANMHDAAQSLAP